MLVLKIAGGIVGGIVLSLIVLFVGVMTLGITAASMEHEQKIRVLETVIERQGTCLAALERVRQNPSNDYAVRDADRACSGRMTPVY